jgi:hypothetical protein
VPAISAASPATNAKAAAESETAMRIELVTKRGFFRTRYFWRIRGGNNLILATSELYSSAAKAAQTAREVARFGHLGLPIIDVSK